MSEIKKCPKCGGEMAEAKLWSYGGIRIGKKGTVGVMGDNIRTFYCKECGYLEFYREGIGHK